jgi:hypothetical protein
MGKDKRDKVILALVVVVILLAGFLSYLFLVQPALSGLVAQGQNEGVEYAIAYLAQQLVQCPSTGVPITYQNQTMNLVALECYQEAAE